jgi:predicted RNA-binding Zn-ribbon protein involved in translation (DUF1610 family)
MGTKKPKKARNPLFGLPYLAVAASHQKKKKLKVLRKRKKGSALDLDAAEAEIRELGFLEGGVPETGYRCPQCSRPVLEDSTECPHCHLVFEENAVEYQCPECDAILQKSMRFCPQCGMDLETNHNHVGALKEEKGLSKPPPPRPPKKAGTGVEQSPSKGTIAPHKEEEQQFNCPNCGTSVLGSTKTCPECEIMLEKGVEIFSCPDCSSTVYADTINCPKCGFNLDE